MEYPDEMSLIDYFMHGMNSTDFSWNEFAACKGASHETFFVEPGDRTSAEPAKAICATCQVKTECLDFAIGNGIQFGIWGGETPSSRRRIKRGQPRH